MSVKRADAGALKNWLASDLLREGLSLFHDEQRSRSAPGA